MMRTSIAQVSAHRNRQVNLGPKHMSVFFGATIFSEILLRYGRSRVGRAHQRKRVGFLGGHGPPYTEPKFDNRDGLGTGQRRYLFSL